MSKAKLTIFERVVLVGALPDILNVDIKPYPFKELSKFFVKNKYDHKLPVRDQALSFYQSL
jgi:hypothetical protein